MIARLNHLNKIYEADLSAPLDISLPLRQGENNPSCYWAEAVKFETIEVGSFVGSVKRGGGVNYQKITFTPHGNGTHTECYGHISSDEHATLNRLLKNFHFMAQVISVAPRVAENGDAIIERSTVGELQPGIEAIVIRTMPNNNTKRTRNYSGTNPPYLSAEVATFLREHGVKHLLIDLPSVDREMDEGRLTAHKAFWNLGETIREDCTITELIFVDNSITDGLYLLNLQVPSFEIDASPSKPVLYKLKEVL